MKKLAVLFLVVALSVGIVGSASALVWSGYFDTPIFDGGVFVNDTVETDVTEEPKEIEKDWLESDERIFPPGWANITPSEELTNFPPGYFDIVPREQLTNFPPGYFEVDWGIDIGGW